MSNDSDSKYVVFNNSTYQLEAYLANANDKGSAFPIRKANINYLEVEDSLAFPGLRGTINISNFYGILQKYDLFDLVNDINLLVIDITNKDAAAISGSLPIKLAFEAIISEAVESSKNIVDKNIILSFEEFNVGYLRYRYISSNDLQGSDTSSCSDYIKQVILRGLNKTKVEDVFKVDTKTKDIENTLTPAPASSIVKETASCYEILRFLMKNCYFEGGIPSLLNINSFYENKKYVRKFNLTNLGTFMSDFFTEVSRGESGGNLSKYVLETFISGDSRSASTFGSNFFDKYDLIRPNFKNVLSKKWVSHSVSTQSATLDGQSATGFYTYEDAKDEYESFQSQQKKPKKKASENKKNNDAIKNRIKRLSAFGEKDFEELKPYFNDNLEFDQERYLEDKKKQREEKYKFIEDIKNKSELRKTKVELEKLKEKMEKMPSQKKASLRKQLVKIALESKKEIRDLILPMI